MLLLQLLFFLLVILRRVPMSGVPPQILCQLIVKVEVPVPFAASFLLVVRDRVVIDFILRVGRGRRCLVVGVGAAEGGRRGRRGQVTGRRRG